MQRIEDGEGNSPLIAIRLPQKTTERLATLVDRLPPHPVAGRLKRADVLRGVIAAGIEAVAIREGIKLEAAARPANGKAKKPKTSDGKIHPNSRSRAQKRAAARLAAGCTCGHSHVRACKLYRQSSAA
jgi:hypothetical protein